MKSGMKVFEVREMKAQDFIGSLQFREQNETPTEEELVEHFLALRKRVFSVGAPFSNADFVMRNLNILHMQNLVCVNMTFGYPSNMETQSDDFGRLLLEARKVAKERFGLFPGAVVIGHRSLKSHGVTDVHSPDRPFIAVRTFHGPDVPLLPDDPREEIYAAIDAIRRQVSSDKPIDLTALERPVIVNAHGTIPQLSSGSPGEWRVS